MIYFESLSFLRLLLGLAKTQNLLKIFGRNGAEIYYVDATRFFETFFLPLLRLCGVRAGKLDFKMMDVRDKGGEIVRRRIARSELFGIQEKILESEAYQSLYHDSWRQGCVEEFIVKSMVDRGIHDEESAGRLLFIVEVVAWHMVSNKCSESILIVRDRAWFDIYRNYAAENNIKLFRTSFFPLRIFNRSFLYKVLIKFPCLYGVLKNLKYGQVFVEKIDKAIPTPKIYVEGRGDVNFENDGDHSDFFWQFNSDFPVKNILYKHHSKVEKEYLEGHGVHSVQEGRVLYGKCRNGNKKLIKNSRFKKEYKVIESILDFYFLERYCWDSFFRAHNAKVYLTWDKYYNHHMVVGDAIKENGGISAVWQMAFDGNESIECRIHADIYFGFSRFSHQIERRLGSSIKYHVITGYLKDYVPPLKKKQALELRKKMFAAGVKKIVFAIDENSIDDERWHTGHGLQRENYYFILEKVLSTPWLGVVFKPKAASTLRSRLGDVADLLTEAEKTGRCYIYEDSGRYTTSAPPILAGLSADVCIHGHLSGGTAALECALEGLPTILIDREGCMDSKLYELPRGKVVFKSWQEAIDAVMEHLNAPNGVPGFGDWSSIIDELDPFRDGKASYRMGTYLHWLIQGFEKGMGRDEIMADAAERYRKQWGADKVLSI